MQFTSYFVFIYRYWNHVHTKHENFSIFQTSVQYIIGVRTETRQKINAVHCSRGIYLFFYLYLIIKLCSCKRQDVSKKSIRSLLLQKFLDQFLVPCFVCLLKS